MLSRYILSLYGHSSNPLGPIVNIPGIAGAGSSVQLNLNTLNTTTPGKIPRHKLSMAA
jgi:hypothetical protein